MEITRHNDEELQVKREVVNEGALRKQETKTVTTLNDGSIEEVHEMLEEVVPMRTKQRVVRKIAMVPTEERTEDYGDDGSVHNNVKTLAGPLDVPANQTSLNDVVEQLKTLNEKLNSSQAVTAQAVKPKKAFLSMADSKYGVYGNDLPTVEPSVTVDSSTTVEKVVAGVLWTALVVVGAYVTYVLL